MKKQVMLMGALLLTPIFSIANDLENSDSGIYSQNAYVGFQAGVEDINNQGYFSVPPFFSGPVKSQNNKYPLIAGIFGGLGTTIDHVYLGGEVGANFESPPDVSRVPMLSAGGLLYNPAQLYADFIPGIVNGDWLYFGRLGFEEDFFELGNSWMPAGQNHINHATSGWRAGLGVEDRLTRHVTLKAGVTFVDLSWINLSQDFGGGIVVNTSLNPHYWIANAGLAYHFGHHLSGSQDDSPPTGFHKNKVYIGVQSGINYTSGYGSLSDPENTSITKFSSRPVNLIDGVYAGLSTDFDQKYYIGGELGATLEQRPSRADGDNNTSSLFYEPYEFYADAMPGIVFGSDTLLFARVGIQGNSQEFDRFSSSGDMTTYKKFSPGLRVGVGIQKQLTQHWSVRADGTYVDMFKVNIGDVTVCPRDLIANLGLSYSFK